MPTTYKILKGDTFAKISRKVYGFETEAPLLSRANPGVYEPLPVGVSIAIPDLQGAIVDTPQGFGPGGKDEAVLTILGRRFRYWDGFTFKRAIDSVDTLELTAPFEPNNEEFRQFFKPFGYPQVTLSIGGELVFTGTQITVKPANSSQGRAVAAASYSLPGVLADCCAPAGVYSEDDSLEFEGADLRKIAQILLKPFGLTPVFFASPGAAFELVSVKASEQLLPFLAKLAKQRGLVITSNAKGEVVFWKSNPGGNPVARLSDSVLGPMITIDPDFSSQAYYSHITGIDPASVGSEGGQYTVKNDRLNGVIRPYTFETTDSESNNEALSVATKAKVGRMFGDAIAYNVSLNTWRDQYGELWRPNTTIVIEAPGVMIYKPFEFLIREVEYRRTSSGADASLVVVLPDAFRDQIPGAMPWDF